MRKNRMMRAASALLVAVLMTTCTISGTFAKYVTEASADDSARVAKWGVTITVTGDDAFATTYNDTAPGTQVESSEKVVAPGTKGTLATAALAGTPEVAVAVTYDAEIKLDKWTYNDGVKDNFYCPLVFTVGSTTIDGADYYNNATAFKTAIVNAIAGEGATYAPGTNLSAETISISWEWVFTGGNIAGISRDVMDTYLGDQAAAGQAPTVEFAMTTTATQVD